MSIQSLDISGYRGFTEAKTINFAIPNGQPGSGIANKHYKS